MNQIARLLILGLIVGSIVLLWLQNQQPISLTMFGFYRTPELALAVWLILFTLAGVITSILLQSLGSFPRNSKPEKVKPKTPVKEAVKNIPRESQPQPEEDWGSEAKNSEPWDNLKPPESPPEQPVTPTPPPPEETPLNTTYSYSYVKATPQQKKNTTDQIYDAPYRIITPPYQENIPPSSQNEEDEEDEEWI